jgi:hypothetical protein
MLRTSNFIPLHLNAHRTYIGHILGELEKEGSELHSLAETLEAKITPNAKYALGNPRTTRSNPQPTKKIVIIAKKESKKAGQTDLHIRGVEKYALSLFSVASFGVS